MPRIAAPRCSRLFLFGKSGRSRCVRVGRTRWYFARVLGCCFRIWHHFPFGCWQEWVYHPPYSWFVRRIHKPFKSSLGLIAYHEVRAMQAHKEKWQWLCEQIAVEQDPTRLIALVDELNKLLDEKEERHRRSLSRFYTGKWG